jgi:hypothetical protein
MPAQLINTDDLQQVLAEVDSTALAAAIARAAGTPAVCAWTLSEAAPIAGYAGYAVPKTGIRIAWEAPDGRRGAVELICKWFRGWHGHGEAATYARLEAAGLPVPRCYGTLRDRRGDEILLLERLPRVGFDPERLADRVAAARALAAIHRADPRPWREAGYPIRSWLHGADQLRETALQALATVADGTVAPEAASAATEVRALLLADPRLVARLADLADALPQGLVHVDNGPQNAGWRKDGQALLWFDWHKAALGCLAFDLLAAFPDPAGPWTAEDEAVAAAYRADGDRTDFRAVLPRLGFLDRLAALGWHLDRCRDGAVDWTMDREEGRRTYRRWTRQRVEGLLVLGRRIAAEAWPC